MRKFLPTLAGLFLAICFTHCSQNEPAFKADIIEQEEVEKKGEEEDGILEMQKQEFEMTKDIALGYIPQDRLIAADKKIEAERKSGKYNNLRTNALTWVERGSNADAAGPANGNTRAGANNVTSGRIRAVWVDLADPTNKTVWIGGIDGGIWKTNDITAQPATWSLANDFFGNLAVGSICQDPSNTNIMYFGTGEKTFNGDAVRGGGVWKSIDHGITWNLLPATTAYFNVSKIICDAAGNVYVATIGSYGILRSNNGGNTWTNITPTGLISYVTDMKYSSTGRLHVVCGYTNNGPSGYRFTDAPATVTNITWTSPVTPFAQILYNTEIAVSGNNLYALTANASYQTNIIYKSTDGGNTWAATAATPPAAGGTNDLSSAQGWYCMAIAIDPADANKVIVGGLNCYRTINGGGAWTRVSGWVGTTGQYVHADQHYATWNGNQVLVASDGGIFYSADGGVTFSDRNVGLRLKQFYAVAIHPATTNYFLAGAQDNGVHQFSNAGLSSSVEVTGGDGAFVHIDQDEPQYQFGSYTYNNYRRSTNGGTGWSSIDYGDVGLFINPSDYDDALNKMYASGPVAGQYLRWNDPQTGVSFTPVTVAAFNASSVRSVSVSPSTANRVFFGTTGGRIVKVDNAQTNSPIGTNITGAGMPGSVVSCVAIGTNDNNLLATYSNYGAAHIWATNNSGTSWTNISGNIPDIPVRWAMFYPEDNTKAMIATEMGVFETSAINGAATVWVQNTSFPNVRTDMLQYRKSDGTVAAATHGRGLWTSTIPFTNPYVRFAANYNAQSETSSLSLGCRNYKDYVVNMTIDQPPVGDAIVTLNVAATTATQGRDYDFTTNGDFTTPSASLTFLNGSATSQPITIRVYDEADIETEESFTLSYSIGGTTNALAAPSSTNYTFVISDNDVTPVAPGVSAGTIGNGTFGSYIQPFRSSFAKAKSQYIYLASELTAAGFVAGDLTALSFNITSKTSTIPYTGLSISLKNTASALFASATFETGTTQVFLQDYSTVSGVNNFSFNTPFNWDGSSNILVEICYDNTAASGTGDNVISSITADAKGLWNRAATGVGCSLAGAFSIVGSNYVRPDITLTGNRGNTIETIAASTKTENISGNETYYFFNTNNTVISSISNASANLGCVTATVLEAGNTWQSFVGGQRSQKVFEITPSANSGASYNVGLYLTTTELAGKAPATLVIGKTTAATAATANAGNTVSSSTTVTPFADGYLFTATFTGFSKFFLLDNAVALPVDLLSFSGMLNTQNYSVLKWQTANQINFDKIEIERSYDGIQFTKAGAVNAINNNAVIKNYSFTDVVIAKSLNYYRLKLIDKDNKFKRSAVIRIYNNKPGKFAELLQNPVRDNISLLISNEAKDILVAQLYNQAGEQIKKWQLAGVEGNVLLPVNNTALPAGIYVLQVSAGNRKQSFKIIKQ
jgi:trimeric autotransporter adhesin